jgi:hypothetical protein
LNDTTGNKVGLVKPPVSLPLEIVAIIGSLYAGFDFEDERLSLRHNGIDGEISEGRSTGRLDLGTRSWISYQNIFNVYTVDNKEGLRTFCCLLEVSLIDHCCTGV